MELPALLVLLVRLDLLGYLDRLGLLGLLDPQGQLVRQV